MDTAAGDPEKQHRGRGQELSSQVARGVKLIINPNIPVYCHLLLWQQAAWLHMLLFGWFIVSKAVTVCVCVTTRSEVKQARGQSNDRSTLSRRASDDDSPWQSEAIAPGGAGGENTEVLTVTRGMERQATGVRARAEICSLSPRLKRSVSVLGF